MRLLFFFIAILVPIIGLGQQTNCNGLGKGRFFYYPMQSKQGFLILRSDSVQKEINLATKDTTFWNMKWSQCTLKLNFLRSSRLLSDEEISFYKQHTATIEVLNVTTDYYVFRAQVSDLDEVKPVVDTMWRKSK